jgi:hypothetical protein
MNKRTGQRCPYHKEKCQFMSDPYDKCTHEGLCPFDFNESEFRKKVKKDVNNMKKYRRFKGL